jgi:hypothetical protein
MTDPDEQRRARERNIQRMSWIAFILAFIVLLLGIIYNRPTIAPNGSIGETTRSV